MSIELRLLPKVSFAGEEINGARLHSLLALLATDLRSGCGTARLTAGLWPDEQPENPAKALQILVSRVRSRLGSDVIVKTAVGYRLALAEDQLDTSAAVVSLSAGAQQARAGEHSAALAHAEAGLALWNEAEDADPALQDPLSVLRTERTATRRALVRARALALARLGRPAEALEGLTEVVRERPRDEEALLELLRCEAATAGPSAAIGRYDAYRRALRDQLGTDPGAVLKAGYQQLLTGEKPVVRHGVAYEPNPLLGRDEAIATVTELVAMSRVTSIIGPGGLGKTRLAHAVSRSARQQVVHFVPLAGVRDDGEVALEVASALGVSEAVWAPAAGFAAAVRGATADPHAAGGAARVPDDGARRGAAVPPRLVPPRLVSGIAQVLGSGPVLLVLDNCEHIVGGVAELVRALVAAMKDLRILTTSRTPLGLSSESVHRLAELDLETTVELFTQRANAARPGVELPAAAVGELCARLDGLPLAVELAAARVRVMSVPEITRRLGDRFALLRATVRDAPERHQTLEAVVGWSWNLLDPDARKAMRALSVFPDGFTAEAARHLLGDDLVLEQLVDQSLLKIADTPAGLRFHMLETVREFSAAERRAAGECDTVLAGFLDWAEDFALATYEAALGTDAYPNLDHIGYEQDNLQLALRHSLDTDRGEAVAATAAALGVFWSLRAEYSRMAALTEDIARPLSHLRPAADDTALIEASRTAALLCLLNSLVFPSPAALRLRVVLRRLPTVPPDTVIRAGQAVLTVSDPAEVIALCDSPEPLLAGLANAAASYVWEQDGDLHRALACAERMLAVIREAGPRWTRLVAHGRIAELSLNLERGEAARRHLHAALDILGGNEDRFGIMWSLATANLVTGDADAAEHWIEQAERTGTELSSASTSYRLGVCAELRLQQGDIDAGLRLWRRAADPALGTSDPLYRSDPPGLEPSTLTAQACCVIAHAAHDRLDLVGPIVSELARKLLAILENSAGQSFYQFDSPVHGVLLIALAVDDIGRGAGADGARTIALAERFGFPKTLQPTLSSARITAVARAADGPAYEDAVSSYAGLGRDGLRTVARATAKGRG
ncbi:ATP-binding protein [Catenulispora pinisilvae]|uniref:ATP-binding protein n=1 Tax=Catenulispora pinisilvae TaxID=2705253 RepID=UPI001892767D|nr:BTAD domain-containing putative transcriptional regulator [Catenulispora pinisilvae]